MQHFNESLPPYLASLPLDAKKQLAALLMNDNTKDSDLIPLDATTENLLRETLKRIDSGQEELLDARDVIKNLRDHSA